MKKSVKIAIPLLLVAVMLLTALSVFILTVTAEGATPASTDAEATLDTYVGESLSGSESGTLATLAAKLADLAPTADTRYVLTLLKDATVSAPISIKGNNKTEVEINLGGFTLAGSGAATVKAEGSGAVIRISSGSLTATATAIYAADGTEVYLNGVNVTSSSVIFEGDVPVDIDDACNSNVYVHDSNISVSTGNIVKENVTAYFYPGTTTINVGTHALQDALVFKSGAKAIKNSLGIYEVLASGHTIVMPNVFSNGMMLQRNKPINVYGYCLTAGAQIRVTIGEVTKTVFVDAEPIDNIFLNPTTYAGETYYKWSATFEPMAAAFGQTITIDQLDAAGNEVSDGVDKTITDVNIGEIWIMAGQSNASLYTNNLEDIAEYKALADTVSIRAFTSTGYSRYPDLLSNGAWSKVTSSNVDDAKIISAVGYTAAVKLAVELGPDVPVGVLTLAQGKTKITTWMDREHLATLYPDLLETYDNYVANPDLELPDDPHGNGNLGTCIYNRHVYSLEGFTSAGVMWYQGCGDITSNYTGPSTYEEYFVALQDIFRRAFNNGDDTGLPFYVMQLAPYSRSDTEDGTELNRLLSFKYRQFDFCNELDETYIVSLGVDGMAFCSNDLVGGAFIHPSRKSPVGIRTADMILANEYGIKVADALAAPEIVSTVKNADGSITITFDTELKLLYGDKVLGFELTDGSTWKAATATIDGNKLTLSASGMNATGLRYGYGRIQIELRDGTIIEVNGANYSGTSKGSTLATVTDALTGNAYEIRIDSTDCIRTMTQGNLTNDSGIPMPLFQMEVTAE